MAVKNLQKFWKPLLVLVKVAVKNLQNLWKSCPAIMLLTRTRPKSGFHKCISRHHSSETSGKVLKKTAQREKQRRRQEDQARRDLVESCLLIRNSHVGASKGPLEIIAPDYEFTL